MHLHILTPPNPKRNLTTANHQPSTHLVLIGILPKHHDNAISQLFWIIMLQDFTVEHKMNAFQQGLSAKYVAYPPSSQTWATDRAFLDCITVRFCS